jgi:hypothetical protein
MWTLADLFLVGLVLDISGAILLAKGLLLSPRTLSKLNTFWGVGYGQHQDRVDNRVAGEFGVAYLVLGFALQFVGYLLDIGGVSTATGGDRLIAALVMAAGALALAMFGWRLLRPVRAASLEAAIECESTEASREISEDGEPDEAARDESAGDTGPEADA